MLVKIKAYALQVTPTMNKLFEIVNGYLFKCCLTSIMLKKTAIYHYGIAFSSNPSTFHFTKTAIASRII